MDVAGGARNRWMNGWLAGLAHSRTGGEREDVWRWLTDASVLFEPLQALGGGHLQCTGTGTVGGVLVGDKSC